MELDGSIICFCDNLASCMILYINKIINNTRLSITLAVFILIAYGKKRIMLSFVDQVSNKTLLNFMLICHLSFCSYSIISQIIELFYFSVFFPFNTFSYQNSIIENEKTKHDKIIPSIPSSSSDGRPSHL